MDVETGGPGWWLASDGRWYPPESRPDGEPGSPPGGHSGGQAGGEAGQAVAPVTVPLVPLPLAPELGGDEDSAAGGLRALRTPTGEVFAGGPAETFAPSAGPTGAGARLVAPAARPRPAQILGGMRADVSDSSTFVGGDAGQPLTGWHVAGPGIQRTPFEFAAASRDDWGHSRPNQVNPTGNLMWSLFTVLAGAGVLACLLGEWYRQLALVTDPTGATVSMNLVASFRLMSHDYDSWRILVPISAGAVIALSLLAALIWRRAPQPRVYVMLVRLLALGIVAAVVSALIVRNPHLVHPYVPPPDAGGAGAASSPLSSASSSDVPATTDSVQILYHLSWAGYVTLGVSILTFILTLPRSIRLR